MCPGVIFLFTSGFTDSCFLFMLFLCQTLSFIKYTNIACRWRQIVIYQIICFEWLFSSLVLNLEDTQGLKLLSACCYRSKILITLLNEVKYDGHWGFIISFSLRTFSCSCFKIEIKRYSKLVPLVPLPLLYIHVLVKW